MKEGREELLARSRSIRLSPEQCVSRDGRLLCWLERESDQASYVLKTRNLNERDTHPVPVSWPAAEQIEWKQCRWIDPSRLAVVGYSPPDTDRKGIPRTLHVLRVVRETGEVEHIASPGKAEAWRISPDCRHAFARELEGEKHDKVFLVDLETARTKPVGGSNLPSWTTDGRYALRSRAFADEGTWVCRYDIEQRCETRLGRIPKGRKLLTVSPRANFALVVSEGRRLHPLAILNLATGELRALDLSCLSGALPEMMRDYRHPWRLVSTWSRDDASFFVNSASVPSLSLVVYRYSVPKDWPRR